MYVAGEPGQADFRNGGMSAGSYAPAINQGGYCLAGISVTFAERKNAAVVRVADASGMAGGTLSACGADATRKGELRITDGSGVPLGGCLNVESNGIVSLITSGQNAASGLVGGNCRIRVGAGGTLRQGGNAQFVGSFGSSTPIPVEVDGGEVVFGCEYNGSGTDSDPVNTAGSTYLNDITLRNGARCSGSAVRIGLGSNRFAVSGTSPSFFNTGMSLLSVWNVFTELAFDVVDVTASTTADLTVDGDMLTFKNGTDSNYSKYQLVKAGAGTMLVNGRTDFSVYPLRVDGGCWKVGRADTMTGTQGVAINGGAFGVVAGLDVSVGKVTLLSSGGVVADAGSTVCFAASADVAWTPGAVLSVSCAEGAKVRFGSTDGALAAGQKARLRLNGVKATLDANGFVVPSGFILILR